MMVYPILRSTFFPFLRAFFKQIEGLENLPKNGPYIIAANHIGFIDYFFIASVIIPFTKRKIHFMAKGEKWRDWLGDRIVKKCWGAIVIDPENKAKCLEEALDYLRQGEICAIYPEGEASKNPNELFKGRSGAARLSLISKAPVVPVGLEGPLVSTCSFIDFFRNIFHFYKKISMKIGQPLTFYSDGPINEKLLEEATRAIMKEIASLSGKNYPY